MTTLEEIKIEARSLTAENAQAVLAYIHELKTCPAVQERARELCAEIAGDHAAALCECVTTGESLPDVERRHDLPLNTLQKYTPALYRRMCGENVGIWTPQQLPEWSRSTSQKRKKTATENGRFFERENEENAL